MKNKKTARIIVIILIAIAVVFLGWQFSKNSFKNNNENIIPNIKILGNASDLVSFSISPGQEVSGILTATGSVRGAYFFEANIQVNILDSDKKVLRAGYGNAKTDWMTSEPVGFETILDFTKLPKGPAYIEIHNDNASGLPENDKNILIPIIIK
ncbi:MAG: Gmad2 immunoglobulin-like domain-containing protein [Candidatus Paceibacterota bacterium]|jgi:hypothetical protein